MRKSARTQIPPFFDNDPYRAATFDFQQCGIYTSVDSDEPVQPPFRLLGN